ncbi:hypothetical protein WJX73_006831 [Symbiochloris irregularis]|uniref:Uncharacterized protein n=1 Tax=Symbiochloris irregularis TaxID=706552 RepID=A0AAW1NWC2_9CHLO
MIRLASLNCYSFEALEGDSFDTRASLLQRKIGLSDGCTFRLIAKNVTGLLPASKKKLKSDTTLRLEDLIRSYQLLDDRLSGAWRGDPTAMETVREALQATQAQTSSFETIIERCLDLPPSNIAPSAISSLSIERLRRLWSRESSGASVS